MQDKQTLQTDAESSSLPRSRSFRRLTSSRRNNLILIAAVVLIIFIFVLIWVIPGGKAGRSESYKDASGAAGLHAAIEYDCKTGCDKRFDFNVYILNEQGQQVSVVRPDKEGHVRLAMPEGNYVMLIGKQFGQDKLFPQEPIILKNGKELELKLQYKETR